MDVVLGFLEEPFNKNELTSNYFPNKVGGKPAWLDLGNIPKKEELECSKCSKQMSFLLQIYAPWDGKSECHHRTIYIFVCQDGKCNSFKAIRSQLGKENQFYPEDAEERKYEEGYSIKDSKYLENRQPTCDYCGLYGKSKCAACQKVNYCCREHQQIDWDLGHKMHCKLFKENPTLTLDQVAASNPKKESDFIFKEFELVNETEELEDFPMNYETSNTGNSNGINSNNKASGADSDDDDDDDDEEHEDDDADDVELDENGNLIKMSSSRDLMVRGEITSNNYEAQKFFEHYLEETGKSGEFNDETFSNVKDKQLLYFRRIIAKNQDQVLRYCRDPNYPIVWVSDKDRQTQEDLPNCENCGSQRKFEFQILPPLLYFLGVDKKLLSTVDFDFGVLSIYTCENSCQKNSNSNSSLINEYIFKQDFK